MFGSMRLFCLFAVVALCSGFKHSVLSRKSTSLKMNQDNRFHGNLAKGFAVLATSLAWSFSPVQAANYGGFGSTYSEVVSPKDAVLNEETAGTDDVKAGVSGLKEYIAAVQSIEADLAKDAQLDVYSLVKSKLNPGPIRSTLNKYNAAFSEDTQRGSDRLIRAVIQDVTELARESQVKPGKARSETKIAAIEKRLKAMDSALTELAAYYPK